MSNRKRKRNARYSSLKFDEGENDFGDDDDVKKPTAVKAVHPSEIPLDEHHIQKFLARRPSKGNPNRGEYLVKFKGRFVI
jgi:hypothetical protein